jgi:hypothetical protein
MGKLEKNLFEEKNDNYTYNHRSGRVEDKERSTNKGGPTNEEFKELENLD